MRITEPVQLIVNPYYYYYHYYILLSLNIHFQVKLGQMVPTVLLLYRVGHVADPVYVPEKNFEDWWNDFFTFYRLDVPPATQPLVSKH